MTVWWRRSDPLFRHQWGLENRGQRVGLRRGRRGADIAVRGAWRYTKGRPEVVVAVIDSGIDMEHPDLAGQLVPQPPDESWDFTGAGEHLPRDRLGHGTHVAGIIAAAENGIGVVGVAPGCRLMPLRVDLLDGGARERADAIGFVARRARSDPTRRYVLNASWQVAGRHPALEQAIADAAAAEVVMIFAAGNGRAPAATYPARLPEVIAVAATDRGDRRWQLSNYGLGVDLAAPGDDIWSTFPAYFLHGRRPYLPRSGTSMAAAFVSGVAALVLSVGPALSAAEVRRILRASCDQVETPEKPHLLGSGRVNAKRAVVAALDPE